MPPATWFRRAAGLVLAALVALFGGAAILISAREAPSPPQASELRSTRVQSPEGDPFTETPLPTVPPATQPPRAATTASGTGARAGSRPGPGRRWDTPAGERGPGAGSGACARVVPEPRGWGFGRGPQQREALQQRRRTERERLGLRALALQRARR